MEQKYCERGNATKNSDEFNNINKYCIRCLEKERENTAGRTQRRNQRKAQGIQ